MNVKIGLKVRRFLDESDIIFKTLFQAKRCISTRDYHVEFVFCQAGCDCEKLPNLLLDLPEGKVVNLLGVARCLLL